MKDAKYTTPDKDIYTQEELELFKTLENDVDNGTYQPMPKDKLEKERETAKKIAKNTIEKRTRKKSLNLRVFEDDIERIKAIALNQGLPYQTFLSSIIHKVATKQIEV
jgi:predicted DNA binding CopG/RHH family protein